jgi:hypothetical protein
VASGYLRKIFGHIKPITENGKIIIIKSIYIISVKNAVIKILIGII